MKAWRMGHVPGVPSISSLLAQGPGTMGRSRLWGPCSVAMWRGWHVLAAAQYREQPLRAPVWQGSETNTPAHAAPEDNRGPALGPGTSPPAWTTLESGSCPAFLQQKSQALGRPAPS